MSEERAEYIAGLRVLADLLEANDDLPVPYDGSESALMMSVLHDDDPKAAMLTIARIVGGRWDKDPFAEYFHLKGSVRGVKLRISAYRKDVCTRVVTGTREVTETVPAPGAPMVEVTKIVEDVEWVCSPLLAERAS